MRENAIRRYKIIGARRFSNYWWASIICAGSLAFLLTGIASYINSTILIFGSENIQFVPQGLVMSFYGLLGVIFSLYLWLTIFWSVGSGFNEFNNDQKTVRIFRWGFPGKNRRINLYYNFNEIEGIRVEVKQGLNPRRNIYLQIRGKREIPLTRIGQPLTYEEIEKKAADLAKFLNVSLTL
uniref:Photosystem I assembly protein Ycf4 n=1 Tax=Lambia antarctica TaxID=101717 RepID=A0A1L2EDY0_9CHLO|nr:photosystem I assembly protein Ycf4 [Lambia antarctica]ANN39066.1 photosystem I assembly protein Ycf4 [Lambia antarctica]